MTVINKIMKTDMNTEVISINEPTVNQDWDGIKDIEVLKYVGIVEIFHAMSICYDNHSDIVCENNEQKPVGLTLLSLRSDK